MKKNKDCCPFPVTGLKNMIWGMKRSKKEATNQGARKRAQIMKKLVATSTFDVRWGTLFPKYTYSRKLYPVANSKFPVAGCSIRLEV